jgi:hypothetical protein
LQPFFQKKNKILLLPFRSQPNKKTDNLFQHFTYLNFSKLYTKSRLPTKYICN